MKIATWNVNSLNVRLPQVLDWLQNHQPDILVLQEIKLDQDKFPVAAFQLIGYQVAWSGQKTYNGVAIISKHPINDPQTTLPTLKDDPQRRLLAATINNIRVIDVYCVNGEAPDSPKFQYKKQWFESLTNYIHEQIQQYENLVLLGDFNIAPTDEDCYAPEKWQGKILCTDSERTWFQNLLNLGLSDSLRQIHPTGAHYTWWDYRGAMFQRGQGLRIDHILTSSTMTAKLKNVEVDTIPRSQERPSDHAPVWAEFDAI